METDVRATLSVVEPNDLTDREKRILDIAVEAAIRLTERAVARRVEAAIHGR